MPHVLGRLARAHLDDIVVVLGAYPRGGGGRPRRSPRPTGSAGPARLFAQALSARPRRSRRPSSASPTGRRSRPGAIDRVVGALAERRGGRCRGELRRRPRPPARSRPLGLGVGPGRGGRSLTPVLVPCDDLGAPEDVDTRPRRCAELEGRIAANARTSYERRPQCARAVRFSSTGIVSCSSLARTCRERLLEAVALPAVARSRRGALPPRPARRRSAPGRGRAGAPPRTSRRDLITTPPLDSRRSPPAPASGYADPGGGGTSRFRSGRRGSAPRPGS